MQCSLVGLLVWWYEPSDYPSIKKLMIAISFAANVKQLLHTQSQTVTAILHDERLTNNLVKNYCEKFNGLEPTNFNPIAGAVTVSPEGHVSQWRFCMNCLFSKLFAGYDNFLRWRRGARLSFSLNKLKAAREAARERGGQPRRDGRQRGEQGWPVGDQQQRRGEQRQRGDEQPRRRLQQGRQRVKTSAEYRIIVISKSDRILQKQLYYSMVP